MPYCYCPFGVVLWDRKLPENDPSPNWATQGVMRLLGASCVGGGSAVGAVGAVVATVE